MHTKIIEELDNDRFTEVDIDEIKVLGHKLSRIYYSTENSRFSIFKNELLLQIRVIYFFEKHDSFDFEQLS